MRALDRVRTVTVPRTGPAVRREGSVRTTSTTYSPVDARLSSAEIQRSCFWPAIPPGRIWRPWSEEIRRWAAAAALLLAVAAPS